ncbi:MAG: alpha/beta fold hydrolase [Bacillota bacterium]
MATIGVGGVSIYCDTGETGPGQGKTVVLVHGAGGSSSRWRYQVKALANIHSPVALDLPGHGLSGGQPCDQVFLYREWVKQFVDVLGLKKIVLAGHSMGGAIALDFALTYQSYLEGLILVSTGARLRVDPARLESYQKGEYRVEWARMSYSPAAPPELVEKGVQETLTADPAVRYADFLACDRFDAMSRLSDISRPTLVICGRDDVATPVKFSQHLAEKIPGARLVLLPRAAHMVMLEKPQEVNEAILEFLQEL